MTTPPSNPTVQTYWWVQVFHGTWTDLAHVFTCLDDDPDGTIIRSKLAAERKKSPRNHFSVVKRQVTETRQEW